MHFRELAGNWTVFSGCITVTWENELLLIAFSPDRSLLRLNWLSSPCIDLAIVTDVLLGSSLVSEK